MGGDDDGVVHDEVEIEDFEYDPTSDIFKYPCPCGDEFVVSRVSFERLTIKPRQRYETNRIGVLKTNRWSSWMVRSMQSVRLARSWFKLSSIQMISSRLSNLNLLKKQEKRSRA